MSGNATGEAAERLVDVEQLELHRAGAHGEHPLLVHGGVGEGAGLILEQIDAARLAGARVFGPDLGDEARLLVMDSASGMAAAVRAGPISSAGKLKWICSRLGMVNLSWALND